MKKKTNKKLALNKQKISELSEGNLDGVKGGKVITWTAECKTKTFGWTCEWISELYTACHCEKTRDWTRCDISIRICEA